VLRSRRRGQSIVEFGLIALLFTLLMFAIVDFGLLLNSWLAVSSGSRDLARAAAVGKTNPELEDIAKGIVAPSINQYGFADTCCGSTDAVWVQIDLFEQCIPGAPSCTPKNQSVVSTAEYGGLCGSSCYIPKPDDSIMVTVKAQGAEVITPLVRPFFGCSDGTAPVCNVTLTSRTVVRYEGREFK
jgi:Flp pilus assembly protein TadG